MTRDEFIDGWCKRSKMDEADLDALDLIAFPCRCGENGCKGWQMISRRTAWIEYDLGRITAEEYEKYLRHPPPAQMPEDGCLL